jgi:hypothetical protein
MIEDYSQCKSETSKKYLDAAIKRQASAISFKMPDMSSNQ